MYFFFVEKWKGSMIPETNSLFMFNSQTSALKNVTFFPHKKPTKCTKNPYKTMVKSMLLEQIVLSILSNQMRDTIINIKGSWQLIPLKISIDNWTFMSIKKGRKKVPICVTF